MDRHHPRAEVDITSGLARALLAAQHPDLLAHDLERVGEGWDNVTYRIGEGLALRIPRREAAVPLLRNEQRWLPMLAPRLGVQVPMPLRIGEPSALFPWPWSVVGWIPGQTADRDPLAPSAAPRLARVFRALHQPAPADAPENALRGVPLRERAEVLHDRLRLLQDLREPERTALREFWNEGAQAPIATTSVWLHGDLHPRNVLVQEGELAGIIDWGDMTGGDPATDLAAAWTLFDSTEARTAFLRDYAASPTEVVRARAWAVFFGCALASSGESDHEGIGRVIVKRLLS